MLCCDYSEAVVWWCSVKIGVIKIFTKFTGKHLCQSFFFNKVAGLRPATLLKKRIWHRCFPLNIVKFLRTPLVTASHYWEIKKDSKNQTAPWQIPIFSLLVKKRQEIRPYSKNIRKTLCYTFNIAFDVFHEERTWNRKLVKKRSASRGKQTYRYYFILVITEKNIEWKFMISNSYLSIYKSLLKVNIITLKFG